MRIITVRHPLSSSNSSNISSLHTTNSLTSNSNRISRLQCNSHINNSLTSLHSRRTPTSSNISLTNRLLPSNISSPCMANSLTGRHPILTSLGRSCL